VLRFDEREDCSLLSEARRAQRQLGIDPKFAVLACYLER
jgi:hypothetical protein